MKQALHRAIFSSCIIGACTATVFASNPVISTMGLGSRAVAMGSSFVALADDFSAVFYNPAGLAFMPIRELQISLDYANDTSRTLFGGVTDEMSRQRLRLGHLGFVTAVPTEEGGFSYALGYASPYMFDNAFEYRGVDQYLGRTPWYSYYYAIPHPGDTVVDTLRRGEYLTYEHASQSAYGNLGALVGAAGWQIAPGIGAGFSISLIMGSERLGIRHVTTYEGRPFEMSREQIKRKYSGLDLRAGILYSFAEMLYAGIRLEAPQLIAVKSEYVYEDSLYPDNYYQQTFDEGSMRTPIRGAVGLAIKLPFLVVSSEGTIRAPSSDAVDGTPLAYWKMGGGAGVEVPIPFFPIVVRAGYRRDEIDLTPYYLTWDNVGRAYEPRIAATKDRETYSAGVGLLIKTVALEAAATYSTWKFTQYDENWRNGITQDHAQIRANVTLSVRY